MSACARWASGTIGEFSKSEISVATNYETSNTTCWSSARAARACARPSKPRRRASKSASSANRCSARRTPSWPRAAWRRRWATWTTATTGKSISPTPCAAANTSTTGAWPNCTRRKRRRASTNLKPGARCSTARRTEKFSSAISAATDIRGWRTSATAPDWK